MGQSLLRTIVIALAGTLPLIAGPVHAADAFVDTRPDGGTDDLDFNPRAGDGLLPVASPNWNPDADFNGSNSVNANDLAIFRTLFGKPPGPSGAHP
jgi:hypothetical protein